MVDIGRATQKEERFGRVLRKQIEREPGWGISAVWVGIWVQAIKCLNSLWQNRSQQSTTQTLMLPVWNDLQVILSNEKQTNKTPRCKAMHTECFCWGVREAHTQICSCLFLQLEALDE